MSGPAKPTMLPEAEAASWADELERWAAARPASTSRSELHLIKEASRLAGEIRDVAREVRDAREADDAATMGIMLEQLGSLRARALSLLSEH